MDNYETLIKHIQITLLSTLINHPTPKYLINHLEITLLIPILMIFLSIS